MTLQYVEQGDSSSVPVLLLHGLNHSWHSFEMVLPHLPEADHFSLLMKQEHAMQVVAALRERVEQVC